MLLTHDLEYLCDFTMFQRQSMIYRTSDLMSKIIDSRVLVLPKNVMLHMLDNVAHSHNTTDDFKITDYPIFTAKGTKKFIFNFQDFNSISTTDLAEFTHRVYRPKLVDNIRAFIRESREWMVPVTQIDTVLSNKNAAVVVNYNPLFRLMATNNRPIQEYRRYRAIVGAVLRNAAKYDRQNILVIPVPDNFTFSRSNFMAIISGEQVSPQKLVDANHFYFFMLDLAAWLIDNDSKLPVFNILSPRDLDKISLMFVAGDKTIVANFGKLASLVNNNLKAFQLINHIKSISKVTVETTVDAIVPTDIAVIELAPMDVTTIFKESELVVDIFSKIKYKDKLACYGLQIPDEHESIVATATLFTIPRTNVDPPINKLTAVYTKIAHRKHGYMDYLLTYILEEAPTTVYLLVDQDNLSAIKLYLKHGFDIVEYNEVEAEKSTYTMRRGPGKETVKPIKAVTDSKSPIVKALVDKTDIIATVVETKLTSKAKSSIVKAEDDGDEEASEVSFDALDKEPFSDEELEEQLSHSDEPIIVKAQPVVLSEKQVKFIEILHEKHKSIKIKSNSGHTTIGALLEHPVSMDIIPEVHPDTVGIQDKSMLKSSTKAFDKQYHEKLFQKDIINNLVTFKDNGLFLVDYTEQDEFNEFTRVRHFTAKFQDIKNKKHTLKFKVPVPDSDGYYHVDGIKLTMTKQLVNLPICKISPTRVSLVSNYNKTLVDKVKSVRNSLVEYISKNAKELGLTLLPKLNTYINIDVPYEYKLLGGKFGLISNKEFSFSFEYLNRGEYFQILPAKLAEYEDSRHADGVLVGKVNNNKDEFLFMHADNMVSRINVKTGNRIMKQPITMYLGDFQVPVEWCDLKILDKNLPIIFILGFKYGLSATLKYLKVKYRVVANRDAMNLSKTEIALQFKDSRLIIDRYPLKDSLIVAGLSSFSTLKRYALAELDDPDTYYLLLTDKGMSTNYLKGISAYFNFFIDPITKEVLTEMHEPTNTRDLLIRAVDMLVSKVDIEPSALANFRLRSTEKIPSLIYNEISRQYANYVNSNFKDTSFSINTESIYQRILQDQTMRPREENNPFHAMKETSLVTYSGFGGRSQEAFVERDRKYPKDAVGILGESTVDSGGAGMTSTLTVDPKLMNLRGMLDTSQTNLSVTNAFSDAGLLMPALTHDDQHIL